MSRIMTFADLCRLAHPTNGNAAQLRLCVHTDDDLHHLATFGDAFGPEARRDLGEYLIGAWLARGKPEEARCIARDPAYCDVVSTEALRRCGADDIIAYRRRMGMEPINVAAMLDEDDEIDRTIAYGEMPGGAR